MLKRSLKVNATRQRVWYDSVLACDNLLSLRKLLRLGNKNGGTGSIYGTRPEPVDNDSSERPKVVVE